MTGYVFLVYSDEAAVHRLLAECHQQDGRYYYFVSSPTMRDKPVQVRPWKLADNDYMPFPELRVDPRLTVFIGGIARPTRACQFCNLKCDVAEAVNADVGGVCYVGIDVDPELNYPKGAARVTFDNAASFVTALKNRYTNIRYEDRWKRVEIKPYVMEEQDCEQCNGRACLGRYAAYFCGEISCLQYYCEWCWDEKHYGPTAFPMRVTHKPLVRDGDQTKQLIVVPHHRLVPSTSASASIRRSKAASKQR